jgi:hypothetical protein
MNRIKITILSGIILIFLLASCNSADNSDPSAVAIEEYIQALIAQDANKVSTLSCADWEMDGQIEVDSLTAVSATIEEMSCERSGDEGEDAIVSCTGIVVFDYNGEIQELDLSTRNYIVRQEGGDWRMCGYR